ncbi:MAG: RNA polymerase-binding protein DksA [Gammaproteobacteria bacterium]|nr:RNA polymerase-binding protein DksA [Gammaproteobacteria bacterium]
MPAGKKKDKSSDVESDLIHGIKPYKEKKGEEYMNESQRKHFRAILEAWKNELLTEISRTVHELRGEHENHPDPNDRASQETDMALELRSRDREGKLIKKINQAVDRINSGDYGYCESCGVEIGVQRLEARPTAEMCIDCKTLAEIREKQMG